MYYKRTDSDNKPQHIKMVENFVNKQTPKTRVIKLLIIVVLLLLIAYLIYSENGVKMNKGRGKK